MILFQRKKTQNNSSTFHLATMKVFFVPFAFEDPVCALEQVVDSTDKVPVDFTGECRDIIANSFKITLNSKEIQSPIIYPNYIWNFEVKKLSRYLYFCRFFVYFYVCIHPLFSCNICVTHRFFIYKELIVDDKMRFVHSESFIGLLRQ